MHRLLLAVAFLAAAQLGLSGTASAGKAEKAQDLVVDAAQSIQRFANDADLTWFRDNVNNAKGVLVVPTSLKAGFIFGGSGGHGVLLARGDRVGDWSYPAFYTIGSVTFGLQIGGEVSEIILMVMTEKGIDALLSSEFKLGADVSVAAGPVGAGAKAQTADILAFSRTKGIYGGINIEGAVVKIRNDRNRAYYGRDVRPTDIFVSRSVSNPGAEGLRQTIAQVSP